MELQRFCPAYLNSISFSLPVMWDLVAGSFLWKFARGKFLADELRSVLASHLYAFKSTTGL